MEALHVHLSNPKSLALSCQTESMAMHPYKAVIALGMSNGFVKLINARKHQEIRQVKAFHKTTVTTLSFSADGHMLIAGSDSGQVCLINSDKMQVINALEDHQ